MWWPMRSKYPEHRPEDVDSNTYDYVVVGGGTAGCALASRLSEDNVSVLLLERGPANDTWMSRIPIVSSNILRADGGATSWMCEPMKYCNDRKSLAFRAEVMGGGSRINSMVYTRGTPADYDAWAALGHPDWSYEKVLPYFIKSENALDQQDTSYHGKKGPWITQTFGYFSWLFRAYRIFTDSAEALGFVKITDTNAPTAPTQGIATLSTTVNEHRQRVSTFDAFLPREVALKRQDNLTICTKTVATRIQFSNQEDCPRVEKIFFKHASTPDRAFSAIVKKEVIVCSGALGSPQVLMLSGIGPRKHLEEHGIEVVRDLPGVGSGLMDHFSVPVAWEVPMNESLTSIAVSPLKAILEFSKYVFFQTGILSIPIQILSLFAQSKMLDKDGTPLFVDISESSTKSINVPPQDSIADIELMPLATSSMDDLEEHKRLFSKMGMFSVLATLCQPKSRGTVRLASSDPFQKPKVDFGILSDPDDYAVARAAIKLTLKVGDKMKTSGFPLLDNFTFPEEKQRADIENNNNEEIDKFIRHRIRTSYHYSSSCRMAPENDLKAPGVVDDELKVHGIKGLRVCDTSVFPQITSHHLQAPAVMVAERCADFIKQEH